MRTKVNILLISALNFVCGAYANIETEDAINLSQEANTLRQEMDVVHEELKQAVLNDKNFSDAVKVKAAEELDKIKLSDSTVDKFVSDQNISEKKKKQVLKGLKKIKDSIKDKFEETTETVEE
jgi:hypothetical protein